MCLEQCWSFCRSHKQKILPLNHKDKIYYSEKQQIVKNNRFELPSPSVCTIEIQRREIVSEFFVPSYIQVFKKFIIIIELTVESQALANVELVSNQTFSTIKPPCISLPHYVLPDLPDVVSTFTYQDHTMPSPLSIPLFSSELLSQEVLLLKCRCFSAFSPLHTHLEIIVPSLCSPNTLFLYLCNAHHLAQFYCLITYLHISLCLEFRVHDILIIPFPHPQVQSCRQQLLINR